MSSYHVLGAFSVIVKLQTSCPALVTSPLVSEVMCPSSHSWFSAETEQWPWPPQSEQMGCCLLRAADWYLSIECIAVLQSFVCLLLLQLLLLHGSNTISFYRHFISIYQFHHHVALLALCGSVSTLYVLMWGCQAVARGVDRQPSCGTYSGGVLLTPAY